MANIIGAPTDKKRMWLWHILLAALLFRVALIALPRVIRWDEPDYLWLGKSLLTGGGYTINGVPELHYTPLLPLLTSVPYVLTGSPEFGSAVWYVIFGALLVLPVYALADRVGGRRVALLSALLVAFYPALSSAVLYWGTMTEPLYILLVYGAAWALALALERDAIWAHALAGALVCLAYLARPEGIVWFAAMGALMVLVWLVRGRLFRWKMLAHLSAYVLAFVLLATPYAYFIHQHTDKWMATGKLGITYDIGEAVQQQDLVLYDKVTTSIDEESGEILWWSGKRFERSIVDVLREDPVAFAERTWTNFLAMLSALSAPTIFPLFLLGPALLGWFRRPWPRKRFMYQAILFVAALPVLSFMPFHIETRFLSPAFPALLIWVADGLWALGDWMAETMANWGLIRREQGSAPGARYLRWKSRAQFVVTLLLFVYMGAVHVRTVERGTETMSFAHEQAGRWLKENTAQDAAVMSRDLAISLYAERGFVASPRADYAEYIDYARRKGATYLVVDEQELRVLRPHLAFLLDDANPPPELERVYSAADLRGRTIVYRLKG